MFFVLVQNILSAGTGRDAESHIRWMYRMQYNHIKEDFLADIVVCNIFSTEALSRNLGVADLSGTLPAPGKV